MAKITFISLYDTNSYGIRLMSANLREQGHTCDVIFLKRYNTVRTWDIDADFDEYPWIGIAKSGRPFKYASNSEISDHEMSLLEQLLRRLDPDLVGLTVNTPLRNQADKVGKLITSKFDIPTIWGGYDPTVNQNDCLDLCDYICVGEGDGAILEIAERIDQGRDFDDVGNLMFRRDGVLISNPKLPLENEIDRYPWRDNDPAHKYFIEDDLLEENYAGINDKEAGVYQAMTARGCPYKCTYCCESTFKDMYGGEKFLRRRSVEDLIAELKSAKTSFNINRIHFEDEIFAMNVKWLRKFVPRYIEEINLPFTAYIYPCRNINEILKLMKVAGLERCCLALESGSEEINKNVFGRVYNRELFLKTARICKELGITFYTDIITFNPYETEEDLKKTLSVLVDMKGGFDMVVNKLFVLKGSIMYDQMAKDGVDMEDVEKRKQLFAYYTRLFWVASYTRHAKFVIGIIDKIGISRRYVRTLNPALLEWVVNPYSATRSFLAEALPRPVKEWMKRLARPIAKSYSTISWNNQKMTASEIVAGIVEEDIVDEVEAFVEADHEIQRSTIIAKG